MAFQPKKDDFLGEWRLHKMMTSLDGMALGRFDGKARIFENETAGDYIYHETGQFFLGDDAYHAERRYLWAFRDGEIAICFEDGRPFHVMNATFEDRHYCGNDIYDVAYQLLDLPNAWQSEWRIQGPRKNTIISNSYKRVFNE